MESWLMPPSDSGVTQCRLRTEAVSAVMHAFYFVSWFLHSLFADVVGNCSHTNNMTSCGHWICQNGPMQLFILKAPLTCSEKCSLLLFKFEGSYQWVLNGLQLPHIIVIFIYLLCWGITYNLEKRYRFSELAFSSVKGRSSKDTKAPL